MRTTRASKAAILTVAATRSRKTTASLTTPVSKVCVCVSVYVCVRARAWGRETHQSEAGRRTHNQPKHATLPSARHTGLPRMLKGAFQRARIRIHVPYSV